MSTFYVYYGVVATTYGTMTLGTTVLTKKFIQGYAIPFMARNLHPSFSNVSFNNKLGTTVCAVIGALTIINAIYCNSKIPSLVSIHNLGSNCREIDDEATLKNIFIGSISCIYLFIKETIEKKSIIKGWNSLLDHLKASELNLSDEEQNITFYFDYTPVILIFATSVGVCTLLKSIAGYSHETGISNAISMSAGLALSVYPIYKMYLEPNLSENNLDELELRKFRIGFALGAFLTSVTSYYYFENKLPLAIVVGGVGLNLCFINIQMGSFSETLKSLAGDIGITSKYYVNSSHYIID